MYAQFNLFLEPYEEYGECAPAQAIHAKTADKNTKSDFVCLRLPLRR